MKFSSLLIYSLCIVLFSCKKEHKVTIAKKESQTVEVLETVEKFISKNRKIKLNTEAKKIVEDWQEYQNMAEFIPKYYNTTTKEALFNSQRLAELTQQLKDSIRIKKFDKPSFRIRLNVLNNEALRLADMDSINSITNAEVIQENKNIVNAFEAIKAKINSVIKKELLEKDLEEFNYLFEVKDTILEVPNIKNQKTKVKSKRNHSNKPRKFNKSIQPLTKLKKNEKK